MTVFSFFRQLYSLDTLDTRFTTSAKTPLKVASDESAKTTDDGPKSAELPPGTSPPRWDTPEFYVYLLVFLICVPQMYYAAWSVSQPDSPNYEKYEKLLSPGWMFGRKVDNSDGQYAGFRDNIPYLAVLVVLQPLLRKAYEGLSSSTFSLAQNGPAKPDSGAIQAELRLRSRLNFDFWSALVFICALHGFSAFKILLILYINFTVATSCPRNALPAATWTFNVCILFSNELNRGYTYASIAEAFAPFYSAAGSWGKFLDSYSGLIPRWEVLFNITILRLISFNLDYYWSLDRSRSSSPVEKQLDPTLLSERDRVDTAHPASSYTSFPIYLSYALYPPLYLAGPVLTFNDYISQSNFPPPSVTIHRTFLYGIRFVFTLLCMELLLHTTYVVAISHSSPDWTAYSPFQVAMLAYFNLHIIWLKLLIPWRFFRLWALIDGVDPPENMVRCMSDNYSALAFWRGWHRSFNRWIVRYIYVPLGGSGAEVGTVRTIFNLLVVFTFVAMWHDINLRLLMWGWLVILFILPEVIATLVFPAKKWRDRPHTYRIICGVGAVANILMMMAANLVGFAVGVDGLKSMVLGVVGSWQGMVFTAVACGALFVGAQVMFEHREEEKRRGIRMKC